MNLTKNDQSDMADYQIGKNATVLLHGVGKDQPTIESYSLTQDEQSGLSELQPWEYYVISSEVE